MEITDKQRELIQGLRDMADLLEANPVLQTHTLPRVFILAEDRGEFIELARALGPTARVELDRYDDIQAVVELGPCSVVVFGRVKDICEPVTTTETVTATTWKIPDELVGA